MENDPLINGNGFNKPFNKRVWQIVVVVIIIAIMVYSLTSKKNNEQGEQAVSVSVQESEVAEESVSAEIAFESLTTLEQIEITVSKNFAQSKDNSIEYGEDSGYVYINAMGIENLTIGMTREGMVRAIKNTLEALKDSAVGDIDFNIIYPLSDSFGNVSNDTVMMAIFSKKVRDKINWDTFVTDNIPIIADAFYVHPALEK